MKDRRPLKTELNSGTGRSTRYKAKNQGDMALLTLTERKTKATPTSPTAFLLRRRSGQGCQRPNQTLWVPSSAKCSRL